MLDKLSTKTSRKGSLPFNCFFVSEFYVGILSVDVMKE